MGVRVRVRVRVRVGVRVRARARVSDVRVRVRVSDARDEDLRRRVGGVRAVGVEERAWLGLG